MIKRKLSSTILSAINWILLQRKELNYTVERLFPFQSGKHTILVRKAVYFHLKKI